MAATAGGDVERTGRRALWLAAAAVLYAAAAVGMAYVAGFGAVGRALRHPHWPWLVLAAALVAAGFGGYYFAYRGFGQVEDGPDGLDTRSRLAAFAAGFAGFLVHGGTNLDERVLRAQGAGEREGKVRVALLAGLEHGMLAVPCSVAAIVLLSLGIHEPPRDFTYSWAILPTVGFGVGIWAAERYRARFHDRSGWRGKLGIGLDVAHHVGAMLRHPRARGAVPAGMLVYWVADMFALWAAMAAFGFHMNIGSAVVAFGTAMIVTRRTGPLGGAGLLDVALAATLWYSGAPWPAAVLGTFTYRFFTLWLPQPLSLLGLPRLRAILR